MKTYEEVKTLLLDIYHTYNIDHYWFKIDPKQISQESLENTLNIIQLVFGLIKAYPADIYPEVDDGYFLIYSLPESKYLCIRIIGERFSLCYNLKKDIMSPPEQEVIREYMRCRDMKDNIEAFIKDYIL